MSFQLLALTSSLIVALSGLILLQAIANYIHKHDVIPIGCNAGFIGSWIESLRNLKGPPSLLESSYKIYKFRGIFKYPQLLTWQYMVAGEKIGEITHAAEDVLSINAAMDDLLQMSTIFGQSIIHEKWHIDIFTTMINRNLDKFLPQIMTEISRSVHHNYSSSTKKDHTSINVRGWELASRISVNVMTSLIIDESLCQNEEWISLVSRFPQDYYKAAVVTSFTPTAFKGLVIKLTKIPSIIAKAEYMLSPYIEKRCAAIDSISGTFGLDVLSALINTAPAGQGDSRTLTLRILNLFFITTHTTSIFLANLLYDIASRPDYTKSLVKEMSEVADLSNLNKSMLDNLIEMDSFMRESARCNHLPTVSIRRKTLKCFLFKDGTELPAGVSVAVPSYAIHKDEKLYRNASAFQGLRFVGDENNQRVPFVQTSDSYLIFGRGRHTCPGRYLVSLTAKSMLVHLLSNYQSVTVDTEDGSRPLPRWILGNCIPNQKALLQLKCLQSGT